MGNLFRFILRYQVGLVFILLNVLAIFLLVRTSHYQQMVVMQRADVIKGVVFDFQDKWLDYLSLRDENSRLARENAQLRNRLDLMVTTDTAHYATHYRASDTSNVDQTFTYISAKVVDNTVNKTNNYLILNVGHNDGVQIGMGVISSTGIVGTVERVSANYCTVMSLLTKQARDISAMLKTTGHVSPIIWEAGDINHVYLREIGQHVLLHVGDTVVTSNTSVFFPEGIMIGTIASTEVVQGKTYDLKIKLSNDFQSLQYVTLIKRVHIEELEQLRSLESRTQ